MSACAAVVMNLFYTGLGITRSLGEQGVRVIGLTAHPRAYGNYTHYAEVKAAPDSREQPEELLEFLLELGAKLTLPAVIFPTRDDDVLFLDRFRDDIQKYFVPLLPLRRPLEICLDKWETFVEAERVGVNTPRTWRVNGADDLRRALSTLRFPCVLKPRSAHHWRKAGNWQLVGRRKAIAAQSPEELVTEYDAISRAEGRALLQEMVPGTDDCLWIAACYLDRNARFVAGFTAQKLIQVPPGLGTGCMVQAADRPDLLQKAAALLEQIGFSGVAEVEFKQDASDGRYKLIEINPRPWDQHVLGKTCGVDLIYIAFCDLTGRPKPRFEKQKTGQKWIAEDVFSLLLLRSLVKRTGDFFPLLRMARGERVYPIWSRRDPLPFGAFVALRFLPDLTRMSLKLLPWPFRASGRGEAVSKEIGYGL